MSSFRLTIRARLGLLAGFIALALLILSGIAAFNLRTSLMERERVKILNITETSLSILKAYEADAATGKMPREEAQKLAYQAIRNMKFAGTEYMFVYDFDDGTRPGQVRDDQFFEVHLLEAFGQVG